MKTTFLARTAHLRRWHHGSRPRFLYPSHYARRTLKSTKAQPYILEVVQTDIQVIQRNSIVDQIHRSETPPVRYMPQDSLNPLSLLSGHLSPGWREVLLRYH